MPDAIVTQGWELVFDTGTINWYLSNPQTLYVSPVVDCSAWWRIAIYGFCPIADATYVNVGWVPILPDQTNLASPPTAAYVNFGGGGQFTSSRKALLTTLSRETNSATTIATGYWNQVPMPAAFTVNTWSSNASGAVTGSIKVYGIRKNPLTGK